MFRREQARDLGDAIVASYSAVTDHEPLILIGHSYGADSAIRILHQLDEAEVQVDLLITLDATNPQPVPGNVRRVVNIYRSSGWRDRLPFFRGLALVAESEGHDTMLVNIDVRDDAELSRRRINHFTIDRDPHVQELILAEVLDCCRQQRSAPDHAE